MFGDRVFGTFIHKKISLAVSKKENKTIFFITENIYAGIDKYKVREASIR